jgi:hypothetical protein
MLGIPARDIEEAEGLRENLAERLPQDRADLTLRQAIAFDQLAVGPPLLLELRKRRGIQHCAARLKLMNMNVDQGHHLPIDTNCAPGPK